MWFSNRPRSNQYDNITIFTIHERAEVKAIERHIRTNREIWKCLYLTFQEFKMLNQCSFQLDSKRIKSTKPLITRNNNPSPPPPWHAPDKKNIFLNSLDPYKKIDINVPCVYLTQYIRYIVHNAYCSLKKKRRKERKYWIIECCSQKSEKGTLLDHFKPLLKF